MMMHAGPMSGFTLVPNWFFLASVASDLSLNERSVLLFIIRRTVGFHKEWDLISLSQFVDGVSVEAGVGLSRPTVIKALARLAECEYIEVQKQWYVTSRYRLHPTVEARLLVKTGGLKTAGVVKNTPLSLVKPVDPQKKNFQNKHASSTKKTPEMHTGCEAHDDDSFHSNDVSSLASAQFESIEGLPESDTLPGVETQGRLDSVLRLVSTSAGVSGRVGDDRREPRDDHAEQANWHIQGRDTPAVVHDAHKAQRGEALMDVLASRQNLRPSPCVAPPPSVPAVLPDTSEVYDRLIARPLEFSPRMAATILATYERSLIETALRNLRHRPARNPAGYLLAELRAGDYGTPREELGRARNAQFLNRLQGTSPGCVSNKVAAPVALPSSSDPVEQALQSAVATLETHDRAQLVLQARQQYARLKRVTVDNVAEDTLWVVSMVENWVRERMLQQTAA